MQREVHVAIIGAGSAGLYAMEQVQKAGKRFVIFDGGELGTTCARVGCMPSKAFIQISADWHRRLIFPREGLRGEDKLDVDTAAALEHVRDLRDIFVDKVLDTSTDQLGDEFIPSNARFLAPDLLEAEDGTQVRAKAVVLAAGSRPVVPTAWEPFRDRIITTDEFFELETLPESLAVIGLGVIGMELGQALHRLGCKVSGFDQLETLAGIDDPVVAKVAIEIFRKEMPLHLGRPARIELQGDKLQVQAGEVGVQVDRVLASMGRKPAINDLGLEKLGIPLRPDGMPQFDPHTMQVGKLRLFIAGDVTGDRPVLHEAAEEGRIAGLNAVRESPLAFRRKTPLAITFCDPNIIAVGAGFRSLDPERTAIGAMRFGPLGRALIMGKNKGVLRVYAERPNGRILGASMIGPNGENLAHLLAWAIQKRLTVVDLLRMPYYHPVIEEGLQTALRDLYQQLNLDSDGIPPDLDPQ